MLTRVFSGIMLVMLCVGVSALALRIQPVKADEQLELTMTVEKTDYYVGEPIYVTLTVTNISNQTITFQYWAKTFDFMVYNNTDYIYQWSKFGAHPFVIVDLSLDPRENITKVLTWPQTCNDTAISQGTPVSPGAYYIYGYFASFDALYELETGPVEVNVDQPISLVASKTVVGQGYVLPLNVSLINLDDRPWAFDVTLSTNATAIETETGINVSGSSILSFTWNTTNFPWGNYNINVTAGNLSAGSSVVLTIPGDLNGDFKVSLPDLVILAQSYGSKAGDPNWNPNADIDNNGVVDLSDLVVLAQHYVEQQRAR
jgi:hypothetical protein